LVRRWAYTATDATQLESVMSKGQDKKKESKKPAAKTLKEKREAKRAKKG